MENAFRSSYLYRGQRGLVSSLAKKNSRCTCFLQRSFWHKSSFSSFNSHHYWGYWHQILRRFVAFLDLLIVITLAIWILCHALHNSCRINPPPDPKDCNPTDNAWHHKIPHRRMSMDYHNCFSDMSRQYRFQNHSIVSKAFFRFSVVFLYRSSISICW